MIKSFILSCSKICWTHSKVTLGLYVLFSCFSGWYGFTHLDIDTDQSHMIEDKLPFRQTEKALDQAFPRNVDLLIAVIDAPTSFQAESAIIELEKKLKTQDDIFLDVYRPPEEIFFRQQGLLFLPIEDLTTLSDQLTIAQPMLGELNRDPTLRGFLHVLSLGLKAQKTGALESKQFSQLLNLLDQSIQDILEKKPLHPINWDKLMGSVSEHDTTQRVLLTRPKLSFDSLTSGYQASQAIQQAFQDNQDPDIRLRLTGPVALSDSNFVTVTEGASFSAPLIIITLCLLLIWAVRSWRSMVSILLSMIAGFLMTAGFASVTVGVLNPISLAFAIMFVGISIDFGIQFVIRYQELNGIFQEQTLKRTIQTMALPLTVAATATAVGFLSFIPTDYRGVSQLGLIAGGGMIIALIVYFTLLPALLTILPPLPLKKSLILPWQNLDHWLKKNHKFVLIISCSIGAIGIGLIAFLPLDFDPLNLQDKKADSVTAFRDLAGNPDNGVYAIDSLLANQEEVLDITKKAELYPEILRVESLLTFIPENQTEKLSILEDISNLLQQSLMQSNLKPAPDSEELASKIREIASSLSDLSQADNLSKIEHLNTIADGGPESIMLLQKTVLSGLIPLMNSLKVMLKPEAVHIDNLPEDLRQQWITPDHLWRIRVLPKDNLDTPKAQKKFLKVIQQLNLKASGLPISITESGRVVTIAFIKADLTALIMILILLGLILRSIRDSFLVLAPLILATLYTVIGCVVFGVAINFANIIALPLLLGIGVAFNIYFVIHWREGEKSMLLTPTCRAILFSALTTGSAFGSLALSSHPGTASMGLLLFMSLTLSIMTTFIILPAIFYFLTEKN